MDLFDKIGRFFGFLGDDDEEKELEPKKPEPVKKPVETKEPPKIDADNNVVKFNFSAANKETSARPIKLVKSEIKTIKPKKFEDAQTISNYLRDKIAIVVNFEETDPAIATKIIDYICGAAYALNGKVTPIGAKVFVCAPENVIVESYEDEKKSKDPFAE